MALPYGTTGSLCPSFLPDRLVGLSVKRAYTIILCAWLPIMLSAPLEASVTLLEATTPVKLPTKHCLRLGRIRHRIQKGWYFKVVSTNPSEPASITPTYPTHPVSNINVKL